jgi:LPS sulfotransferase NodH
MFTPSYLKIAEHAPALLSQIAPDHVIYLTRRDKIEQAVSYALAINSGAWFSGTGRSAQSGYSRDAVERALRMIEQQEQSWQRIFDCAACSYLPVYYEDVIADWQGVVRSIADFCGVTLGAELDALRHVPLPDKQGDQTNREWVEAYRHCLTEAPAQATAASQA